VQVHGKRTEDHPVAGVALFEDEVLFLVHEYVPGITFDQASPSHSAVGLMVTDCH
jgi:hypothetical protein